MQEVYTDHEPHHDNDSKCPEPTMEYLKKLEEKSLQKYKIKAIEDQRVALAIKMGVCPVCGCKIISRPIELFNPPKKYLWGLIKQYSKTWDYRNVCSNDETHYEYKGDNDDYYGGY